MASLTRDIEEYISSLFEQSEKNEVLLRRKDIAEMFGCVPSQINYVLRSRFAPEHGFLVQSQRGGHGYIRILQLRFENCDEKVDHLIDLIDIAISEQESRRLLVNFQKRGWLSPRERLLVEVSLRNQEEQGRTLFDLPPYKRDTMRADLLKKMLVSLTMS